MTTGDVKRRPGGSNKPPGRSGVADEVIALVARALWAHYVLVVSVGVGIWVALTKPLLIAAPIVVALVVIIVVTLHYQIRHARNVWLRGALPTKFRSVGIVNQLGSTPPVRSVRHDGGVVVIVVKSRNGHPAELFVKHKTALCAVLAATSIDIASDAKSVTMRAVRRSAHES